MHSYFNLQHLKFFCDTVTYNSVTESAKLNYVTQSAISQAIVKLEKQLGVSLIYHNRQKLYVTTEGKILYEHAKEIFKSVQETFNKVNQTKEQASGPVRFVTTKSLGMSFLAPIYQKIRQELPQVDLRWKMGGRNLIRTMLKREEVEFAIVVYDENYSQFEKMQLATGCYKLYQAKRSPKKLIEKGIVVDYLEGPYVKDLQKHLYSYTDLSIEVQVESAGWELAARFAELGIGVSFIPEYVGDNPRYAKLEEHPLNIPHFEYEICAIYNKATKLSNAALACIEHFNLD